MVSCFPSPPQLLVGSVPVPAPSVVPDIARAVDGTAPLATELVAAAGAAAAVFVVVLAGDLDFAFGAHFGVAVAAVRFGVAVAAAAAAAAIAHDDVVATDVPTHLLEEVLVYFF